MAKILNTDSIILSLNFEKESSKINSIYSNEKNASLLYSFDDCTFLDFSIN